MGKPGGVLHATASMWMKPLEKRPLSGTNISYTFTGLNALKPEMIAEATKNARRSAEQFAHDSGTDVGRIKTASQGYFSVGARDGEDCDDC